MYANASDLSLNSDDGNDGMDAEAGSNRLHACTDRPVSSSGLAKRRLRCGVTVTVMVRD